MRHTNSQIFLVLRTVIQIVFRLQRLVNGQSMLLANFQRLQQTRPAEAPIARTLPPASAFQMLLGSLSTVFRDHLYVLGIAAESPFLSGAISIPTFAATITSDRFLLFFSQFPIIASDSPPLLPGIHWRKYRRHRRRLNPAAIKASRILNDVTSGIVQPKNISAQCQR
jgi:hypothetical protein